MKAAWLTSLCGIGALAPATHALLITSPSSVPSPTILDYANSPAGPIAPGSAVTNQYAAVGVVHNGHTTTPPGPAGISSGSGLPALEIGNGGPANVICRMDFSVPVRAVGAYYLMVSDTDSIRVSAFTAANTLIESQTVTAAQMPMHPGPFGFNEGFMGMITDQAIHHLIFESVAAGGGIGNLYAIDDFHFSPLPAPSAALPLAFGAALLVRRRRERPALHSPP
jgi:hypothetical protein